MSEDAAIAGLLKMFEKSRDRYSKLIIQMGKSENADLLGEVKAARSEVVEISEALFHTRFGDVTLDIPSLLI